MALSTAKVRTRIAPSPTGTLHVGTARSALFNELFARKHGGSFIVRIEDTDRERSRGEFETDILEGLRWLGLAWQEGPDVGGEYGPYRQSERAGLYREALEKLVAEDKAYIGDTPADSSHGATTAPVTLRVEPQEVTFTDLIRGTVTVSSETWGGDFVIARSIGDPLYHLAVVVDDALMEISHVIRGEDHLTNTARHVLLQRALGYERPAYAHLPLLLDEQRRKLSKRGGEISLLHYREQGILPQSMVNYLALLGWNPGSDQEFFTHEELIQVFDLPQVQKGGAIFDQHKLLAINKHYLSELEPQALLAWATAYIDSDDALRQRFSEVDDAQMTTALETEQGRLSSNDELEALIDWIRPDWEGDYPAEMLVWRQSTAEDTIRYLEALAETIKGLDGDAFSEKSLSQSILAWIQERGWGNGDVLWPLRVALSGREHSPGPFELAAALGKEATLQRLRGALEKLKNLAPKE